MRTILLTGILAASLVAGCSTPSPTAAPLSASAPPPSSAPATAAPAATVEPTAAPTPSPTASPTPLALADYLTAARATTATRDDALKAGRLVPDGNTAATVCLNGEELDDRARDQPEAEQSAAALALDRELACLEEMTRLWLAVENEPAGTPQVQDVTSFYAYALDVVGGKGREYLESALTALGEQSGAPPAPPSSLKPRKSLASARSPYAMTSRGVRAKSVTAMHRDLHDAYAAKLPAIAAAIRSGCGEECSPFYRGDIAQGSIVFTCVVYGNDCHLAPLWQLYQVTGDKRIYEVIAGLLDFYFATLRIRAGDVTSPTRAEMVKYFMEEV